MKTKIKTLIPFALLLSQSHLVNAISPEYIDQITCKNWRTELKQPMSFPSFVATSAFKKEFKQTKNSDEDQGDYYSDVFKPKSPQRIFNGQILSVTSDSGYGGEWNSAGFIVDLKGNYNTILKEAQQHLKVTQWQTAIQDYSDETESRKIKTYYALVPHQKSRQARYISFQQDPKTQLIHFNCRATEGDIPLFIRNMRGDW